MGVEFNPDKFMEELSAKMRKTGNTGNTGNIGGLSDAQMQKLGLKLQKSEGGKAKIKVSENDIEKALNEPSPTKALKELMNKSPIGKQEKLEDMGYKWHSTAYHLGAPTTYQSSDGGTVTIYPGGGTAEMGEDKRKTVYENGRFKQEMFYDENGKLTGGKIIIKDNVAGFTERQIDFTMDKDGKMSVFE